MQAPLALQFLLHMLVHARKVDDVVGSITQLGFRQGTTRPVGEGIHLLERHAALGSDQCAVADLLRVPQKRRRHLRVEKRLREHAHLVPQDLKVLPTGVQHLHHIRRPRAAAPAHAGPPWRTGRPPPPRRRWRIGSSTGAHNRSSRVKTRCRWQGRLSGVLARANASSAS